MKAGEQALGLLEPLIQDQPRSSATAANASPPGDVIVAGFGESPEADYEPS